MHYLLSLHHITKYIKENLTGDLSLETLADYAHFSPYHFHRQFLQYTGLSPMEYIRRYRIRSASRDLISSSQSIIEIAAKYRFESQDGFCRAFKKYYGITPGEYKKLNHTIHHYAIKSTEEVKINMFEMNFYEKLSCSYENKKNALITLEEIIRLSEKTKRHGLLSLEAEIDTIQPNIFKKGIQLLIDGIEPSCSKEILMNYIMCGDYNSEEFLKRIIIIDGILAIQQGVPTEVLKEKLFSYFGEDFIDEIQKHLGIDSESQSKNIEQYINNNQAKPALTKETSLLDEPFCRMDSRSLQRLLREIESHTLAIAITGASGKTQSITLKNLSKRLAASLIEVIADTTNIEVDEIVKGQKHIIETLNTLRNQGDILI